MKNYCLLSFLLWSTFVVYGQQVKLIDPDATEETKALFYNLNRLSEKHILFGHQHATEYGHGWSNEPNRSDVQSVTGSHPAVIGVDFSGLSGRSAEETDRNKAALKENIAETYNRGGITTVSWHFNNPASAGEFYWKDAVSAPAIKLIMPGGSHHGQYKLILQTIASLANSTLGKDGKLVPMIFRPYHELDGDWFWWGRSHCTVEDVTAVWRFTVSYLRDSLKVHNFIYAFSPDNRFSDEATYLERYPGNEWVDMVGMDNYGDWGRDGKYDIEAGIKKLKIIVDYASKFQKVAAFTETGLESIPNGTWWTETLLKALKNNGLKLAYVLVWRNDSQSATHYYAPFPGHSSVPDFLKFYHDPFTLFEKDLPNMYKLSKK